MIAESFMLVLRPRAMNKVYKIVAYNYMLTLQNNISKRLIHRIVSTQSDSLMAFFRTSAFNLLR